MEQQSNIREYSPLERKQMCYCLYPKCKVWLPKHCSYTRLKKNDEKFEGLWLISLINILGTTVWSFKGVDKWLLIRRREGQKVFYIYDCQQNWQVFINSILEMTKLFCSLYVDSNTPLTLDWSFIWVSVWLLILIAVLYIIDNM